MLQLIPFNPPISQSLDQDLSESVVSETIGSRHFSEVVSDVLEKHHAEMYEANEIRRTIGDTRGALIWVAVDQGPIHPRLWESLFFWPRGGKVHVQRLRQVEELKSEPFLWGDLYWMNDRLIMCGWATTGGNFGYGGMEWYRFIKGVWSLKQRFTTDESVTESRFRMRNGKIDPNDIIAPIAHRHAPVGVVGWYPTTEFDEWIYRDGRYVSKGRTIVKSPLETLKTLAGRDSRGTPADFRRLTTSAIRSQAQRFFIENRHVSVYPVGKVLYNTVRYPELDTDLGYRFRFEKHNGDYVLIGMIEIPFKKQ